MENNCVSLETAKRLKAAGFEQETAYKWCFYPDGVHLQNDPYGDDYIAAPTAQEIVDQFINMGQLDIRHYGGNWSASLLKYSDRGIHKTYPTMAEALASLWLKLQGASDDDFIDLGALERNVAGEATHD